MLQFMDTEVCTPLSTVVEIKCFTCIFCFEAKQSTTLLTKKKGRCKKADTNAKQRGVFNDIYRYKKHLTEHHYDKIVIVGKKCLNFACPHTKMCGAEFKTVDHWFDHICYNHQEFLGPLYGAQISHPWAFKEDKT